MKDVASYEITNSDRICSKSEWESELKKIATTDENLQSPSLKRRKMSANSNTKSDLKSGEKIVGKILSTRSEAAILFQVNA